MARTERITDLGVLIEQTAADEAAPSVESAASDVPLRVLLKALWWPRSSQICWNAGWRDPEPPVRQA